MALIIASVLARSCDQVVRHARRAAMLGADWLELESTQDFEISANQPVSVAQLLASSMDILSQEPFGECVDGFDCHPGHLCSKGTCLLPVCCWCSGPGFRRTASVR